MCNTGKTARDRAVWKGNEMMPYRSPVKGHTGSTSSGPKGCHEQEMLSVRQMKWIMTLLLAYFGLRLLFFSITIADSIPPDEETHMGVSRIFSEVYFFPENSSRTYPYGLVTNIPWLYYWIMGRLLTVNFFGIPDLLFLRLLNIPLAFTTIYFVWRTLRLLTDDRLTQVLFTAAMTNTLMFSFLSSFVTYDNLANLLAAMSVYYLLAFFRTRSGDMVAAYFFCQLAGSLTKISLLPLALVLNVLLLVHEFKNLRALPAGLKAYFKAMRRQRLGLVLGIFLTLAFNIQLYGDNYFSYGVLNPEMSDVLPADKAMQNRLEARNTIFSQFKEGRISREQALAMASQISKPADRNDTMYLILSYEDQKKKGVSAMGPLEYIPVWGRTMLGSVFGILAHRSMINEGITIVPFVAMLGLTGLAFLIRWRPQEAGWLPACLAVTAVFYGVFLMYYVNYGTYRLYENPLIGLQGRYIFPVIGPIYVLVSCYLPRLFKGKAARLGTGIAAAFLFIAFDFPYFLARVTPDWFAPIFR
jgi:hypothetical protein